MAYKLLGMLTWKGIKWFLRRRYGAALAPKPLIAGGVVVALIAVAVAAARQRGELGA
jgi:hypothetical protein